MASAFADTSLKAEVDKTRITTEEAVIYKLSINSSAKKIPKPDLPGFEGFAVLSQSQASKISISAGVQTSSVTYVFILAPVKSGKFGIGPSRARIEGRDYSSDTFEIEVTQGKVQPKAESEDMAPLPEAPVSPSEAPRITL